MERTMFQIALLEENQAKKLTIAAARHTLGKRPPVGDCGEDCDIVSKQYKRLNRSNVRSTTTRFVRIIGRIVIETTGGGMAISLNTLRRDYGSHAHVLQGRRGCGPAHSQQS
jgi:ribose 5-phosphate isomerase RpiB